jgi:hypothetical protein
MDAEEVEAVDMAKHLQPRQEQQVLTVTQEARMKAAQILLCLPLMLNASLTMEIGWIRPHY